MWGHHNCLKIHSFILNKALQHWFRVVGTMTIQFLIVSSCSGYAIIDVTLSCTPFIRPWLHRDPKYIFMPLHDSLNQHHSILYLFYPLFLRKEELTEIHTLQEEGLASLRFKYECLITRLLRHKYVALWWETVKETWKVQL